MTTQARPTTELDSKLNHLVLEGKLLEAFDTFYADSIVMQEGAASPREGKAANRAYEEAFVDSIAEFHSAKLLSSAVDGDKSYSEWTFDFTPKGGERMQMTQVASRTWKDGEVVFERFYAAQ